MIECCCGDDGGEKPDFYTEEWRTARKPHVCVECGETIASGQRYHHARGLWDGYWDTHSTCEPCARMREDLCRCGWIFGGLRQALRECLGVDYLDPTWVSPWHGEVTP